MPFFLAIVANVILSMAAVGYGTALRRLFPERFTQLDRIAVTLLGGLGLLGTFLFTLGQVWFSKTAIILVLLIGALLAFQPGIRMLTRLFTRNLGITVSPISSIVVALVLLVTAIAGLAEPTGDIKMDSIAYHLLGPRVWLRDGVIRPVVDECLTSFPAIVETQYASLMAVGGQRAPGLFSVTSLVAMLFVAAALGSRLGLDSLSCWWVAALIITMPVLYRGAYGGFVDVVYSGLILAAARVAFDAQRPQHYRLFGILCGLAMGTKYTGLLAALLLAICILVIAALQGSRENDHGKILLKHLAVACMFAAAVAAPWYIRNWVLMGSPIYPPPPFLLHFFHPKYLPPEALQDLLHKMWREGAGMGRGFLSFLLLPFNLTYHPANFMNGAGGIGLVPLILAPFGLFVALKDRFAQALVLFSALQALIWFVTAQEARYLIHDYVVAGVLGVFGWKYAVKAAPRTGSVLSGWVIACSIAYGLFMIGAARTNDLRAVLSRSYENIRRHEDIPFLESFDYLNSETTVRKVLILEPLVPTYYLQKSYIKPVGRFGEQTLPESTNLRQILSSLPRLGVSHILDVRRPQGSFRLPDHFPGSTLLFEREDQRIYSVN